MELAAVLFQAWPEWGVGSSCSLVCLKLWESRDLCSPTWIYPLTDSAFTVQQVLQPQPSSEGEIIPIGGRSPKPRSSSKQCQPIGPTPRLLGKGCAIKFILLGSHLLSANSRSSLMKLCRSLKNNSCLITFILLINERKDFLSLMYHACLAGSPAWPQVHLYTWHWTGYCPCRKPSEPWPKSTFGEH